MIESLGFFTASIIGWMLVGIVVSTVVAIIPGLGGLFALVMLLPLAYTLPPEGAIALLLSAMAVSGTANTVTGVLFGVPGSSTGVATILDGYPMAKKGEGGRALAAGLTASGIGGVLGALVLGLLLPFIRPIVMSLGSPEFFVLIFGALLMMAFVGQGSPIRSLTAGLFGVMMSFVGLEMSSATPRYTFGSLYLWDGIRLAPLFIGLFAISEMMLLLRKGGSITSVGATKSGTAQLFQGIRDVFIKWRILAISSIVGVIVGLAPGLGATGGQFVAYSQAARFSKRGKYYGTGEVEGVIASDAATNSQEAGALVPTLAFGIPGSAPMAILVAALIAVGVQPGRQLLENQISLVWFFVWILVFANLIAAALTLSASSVLAKVTKVRPSVLVPPVLLFSLFGAYVTSRHLGDVLVAVVAGFAGYVMVIYGYSRATFVIGFVLGVLVERHFLLSMRLYGVEFLLRPIALGIGIFILVVVLGPALWQGVHSHTRARQDAAG